MPLRKLFLVSEDDGAVRLRRKRTALALLLLVAILVDWPQFWAAAQIFLGAIFERSVLWVVLIAIGAYFLVALIFDPVGTFLAFAAATLPVQDWEWGGRPMRWLQRGLWKAFTWLDGRRSMELGYSPEKEEEQLRAIHQTFRQQGLADDTKRRRIRRIGNQAMNPAIESAAKNVENQIEGNAPSQE